MSITIKDMKLTFTVEGSSLTRTVSDLNTGTVIWESTTPEATEVDRTIEGLEAYENQMKQLPFWNIVQVNYEGL
jgi:hypothetical protein